MRELTPALKPAIVKQMQFQAIEPNVEVNGQALAFTISGFRLLPSVGLRFLHKYGLAPLGPDGKPALAVESWHPQTKWLECFGAIYREVGPNTTLEIGRQLGRLYPIPPHVTSIHEALQWLDVGYHLAHRKHGAPMFDLQTRHMTEGIGHYGYKREGERRIRSRCDTPYPCELDLGIITGLTLRLDPTARVRHEESGCRKQGVASCSYLVEW
jgi:hypothetical protein